MVYIVQFAVQGAYIGEYDGRFSRLVWIRRKPGPDTPALSQLLPPLHYRDRKEALRPHVLPIRMLKKIRVLCMYWCLFIYCGKSICAGFNTMDILSFWKTYTSAVPNIHQSRGWGEGKLFEYLYVGYFFQLFTYICWNWCVFLDF